MAYASFLIPHFITSPPTLSAQLSSNPATDFLRSLTSSIQLTNFSHCPSIFSYFGFPSPSSIKSDVPYAELAGDVALGVDDPVFNIDSLLDDEYVSKAIDKAGFKEYTYTEDDLDGTVTVHAIERTLKNNTVKIRRFYN